MMPVQSGSSRQTLISQYMEHQWNLQHTSLQSACRKDLASLKALQIRTILQTLINAFDKLTEESKFQELSPGGAISYVEVPNMQNNIQAVLQLMKHIYNTIMYAELNTKSDYCQVCGYTGEIQITEDENKKLIWKCPNCGNTDQNKMNVARRTCGYIGTQFWNQGRTQEIKERVLHL